MKKHVFLFAILNIGMCLSAQNFSVKAKSGDTELDASLNAINVKAKTDINIFKKDLSLEFNIGEPKIEKMLAIDLSPADVYMTFEIAGLTKKDPDIVLDTYTKNKDKGWGVIAKEMGIKPGSAEFHALKGKAKNKKDKGNKKGAGKGNGKSHGK
ncbi:MAG: hypothetical protein H0W73_17740 [Bacteroidetes bacterium]|nr:hypothetical protein [Bacteroidota bacterium]